MKTMKPVTEEQILAKLHELEPAAWPKVLAYLNTISAGEGTPSPITAQDLLESGLVGLWKDKDMGDSLAYARSLRKQASRR